MKISQLLIKSIRNCAIFNPEVQAAPACILWPDRDRQWESVIPILQAELPELLTLGDYVPEKRMGPAIWLRCVIAGRMEDMALPEDRVPIFYLPGISRQDLRAVESCHDHLKPLAELQYRGVIWSQLNAKDWTILAFLKSDQGGLGQDVAQDNEAKNAMQLALYRLLDEDAELLKGKRLDKDYFNKLFTGGDPIRDLLQWLNGSQSFQLWDSIEAKAFIEVCKSQFAFNPKNEDILAGAAKLATHEGPWYAVWERFCEAPKRYPNIPSHIRKCPPPKHSVFWHLNDGSYIGWPQWNEDQEKNLHSSLMDIANIQEHEARNKILEFEKQHGQRRELVWAELGEAPLACALAHLAAIAEFTKTNLSAGSPDDMAAGYQHQCWKIDDCVMRALAHVESNETFEALATAIRSIYLPWAEASARHLQKVWVPKNYEKLQNIEQEDCVLFVDGLRFDCAKRLAEMLETKGFKVDEELRWAALPSVTGTGKPAVAPLKKKSDQISEAPESFAFEPMTAYQLRKAIGENGYVIPDKNINVYPSPASANKIWVEFGDIDHEGHDRGWKLAKHIDALLSEIKNRIDALLDAGWKRVRIVTDHGWLLLPGGLPKIELPSALAENKWGRCASIKQGASTDAQVYPWYWNPNQFVALADGISCFKKGEEYAHGGLSLQECLTLQMTVHWQSTSPQ